MEYSTNKYILVLILCIVLFLDAGLYLNTCKCVYKKYKTDYRGLLVLIR